ncbi:MAG: hypothetical protein ABIH76_06930, partial [Candidatus Bathyarchaeota archaeon]
IANLAEEARLKEQKYSEQIVSLQSQLNNSETKANELGLKISNIENVRANLATELNKSREDVQSKEQQHQEQAAILQAKARHSEIKTDEFRSKLADLEKVRSDLNSKITSLEEKLSNSLTKEQVQLKIQQYQQQYKIQDAEFQAKMKNIEEQKHDLARQVEILKKIEKKSEAEEKDFKYLGSKEEKLLERKRFKYLGSME